MFIAPDGTFWVQLFNFAVFFALLNVVFLRPVSRAIRTRREYINSVTTDYDTYQAQGNELRRQAEDLRASARRDAEAALSRARAESSNQAADLAANYASEAQGAVEKAHQAVAAELQAARGNEAQIVQQLADLMVERTLGEAAR